MSYDTFSIRRYGRLVNRDDWVMNGNNYSEQLWNYEGEIYIILMKNGSIIDVRKGR